MSSTRSAKATSHIPGLGSSLMLACSHCCVYSLLLPVYYWTCGDSDHTTCFFSPDSARVQEEVSRV
jgi:hypothetical protein